MTTITAVDLRENLKEIIQPAANGEEVLISYRRQTLTKIVPTQAKKPNGKALLDLVNILTMKQRTNSDLLVSMENIPPDKEKKMWQELRAKDFENELSK